MTNEDVARKILKDYRPRLMSLIATYAVFKNKDESWAKECLTLMVSILGKLAMERRIILVKNDEQLKGE